MQADQIAIGAFIGGLMAYAVKGLVDLLFYRFGQRRIEHQNDALANAARREIDRVRRRQRITLYKDFDDKLHTAVHEMSQGWNRMSLIYAARDQFTALKRLASEPVVDAARRMCDICVEMLQHGYSDVLHNRFHRAQIEFREVCRDDLNRSPSDDHCDHDRDEDEKPARVRRKYISP